MKTEITSEEKTKLINRACPGLKLGNSVANESVLKEALVKSLLKTMTYRQEVRRLNQTVAHASDLRERNSYLTKLIHDLEEDIEDLIGTSDLVGTSTDISELAPDEITKVETPNAIKSSIPPKDDNATDSYREWDMRTRYPSLPKRAVGVV